MAKRSKLGCSRHQIRVFANKVKSIAGRAGWGVVRDHWSMMGRSRYITLSKRRKRVLVRLSDHERHFMADEPCVDFVLGMNDPEQFEESLNARLQENVG